MYLVPVLLKPKLLSIRNRWRTNYTSGSQIGRDLMFAIFSVGVVLAIYFGCLELIKRIQENMKIAFIPPSLPLSLILLMLFSLLILSNSISAFGALFLGRDLDMVLSAPISRPRFFLSKVAEITFSSSWMAAAFGLPVFIAFGQAYQGGFNYYFIVALVLVPYFLIPAAIAIIITTLFARFIPINRTREVLLAIGVASLAGIYLIFQMIDADQGALQSKIDILRIVAIFSVPHTHWLPSYWTALPLGEFLSSSGKNAAPYVAMLYGAALVSLSCAYLIHSLCHFEAFSKAKSSKSSVKLDSKLSQRILIFCTPFLSKPYRAIMSKELKTFSRDLTQAIQLLLLIGICMIYLYNFKILHAIESMPDGMKLWWQGLLVISNLAMGAFVITAVCTRFVFPSISLEGQTFWILHASPMHMREVVRAKFWFWLIPVATISSVVFASGSFAINAPPRLVLINAIASWIVCYGIVGLAIGLGAVYANFDWEHPSQLAASFGSLMFMLVSTVLITINLIPAGLLVFFRTLRNFGGYTFTTFEWYACVTTAAFLLTMFNYVAAHWALSAGENALIERMK